MNKKKIAIIAGVVVVLIVIVVAVIILIPKEKKLKYEVIVDSSTIKTIHVNKSKTRKNEIIKQKDSYYLIIHEDEQENNYTLEVQSVSTTKEDIKVVVKKVEGTLKISSNPKAIIKLDKKPKNIEVLYR